jgi:transposase
MFIRLNKSPRTKNPIVQIIESYRQNGKVKQRIVASLGAVSEEKDFESLKKLANDLILKVNEQRRVVKNAKSLFHDEQSVTDRVAPFIPVNPSDLKHESTVYDGFDTIIAELLRRFGIGSSELISPRARAIDGVKILRLLLSRIWRDPGSKRDAYLKQTQDGFGEIELHHIYRFMDHILKFEKKILKKLFEAQFGSLAPNAIDCIFVDVTTLYFESVRQDQLRDFGYSKDQKFHSTQVVLCLIVDADGVPISYKTFKGNTGEVSTLLPALLEIRQNFSVKNMTVVTDRGLASKNNIEEMEKNKFSWITAAKIKKLPPSLRLNDLSTFEKLSTNCDDEDDAKFKVVIHPKYPNSNLLVTYSKKRADKDKHDREKLVEKLKAKLVSEKGKSHKPGKLITNQGYKKFVKFVETGAWELNDKSIADDAVWDGFHGIAYTNSLTLKPEEILTQYRGLWRIEDAFRVAKNFLEIRPMFHWTPNRINSHVLICYIALFAERYLETALRAKETPMTPLKIRQALQLMHTVHLKDNRTNQKIKVPARLSSDARTICKLLEIKSQKTVVQT